MFCKTGSEQYIADNINNLDKSIQAYAPTRIVQEKRKGKWEENEKLLIPSYVFIYTKETIDFNILKKVQGIYKVLEYEEGVKELIGSDLEYALWIYKHKGKIGISKTLLEGSKVKVVDGPLTDGIGTIIKLDRHKRRVWVEFDFDGIKRKVSLSVIDITSY